MPDSINVVVQNLTHIIEESKTSGSALGYFPALYRRVTKRVGELIDQGNHFDDDLRMKRLVINFAERYIEAYRDWKAGVIIPDSWKISFEAGKEGGLLVLQHLVLGMNAHINFDLGIAAAKIEPGGTHHTLEGDFGKINEVLFAMIDSTQDLIGEISPAIYWLDRFSSDKDEWFAEFSLKLARNGAWKFSQELAAATIDEWPNLIEDRDRKITKKGFRVISPGVLVNFFIKTVKLKESEDIRNNISVLEG